MKVMKDYKLMAVGQIVADCFDYAKVFNKYGIDFCCNGDVSLADACGKMGIDADCLLEELKQIKSEQSLTLDFKSSIIVISVIRDRKFSSCLIGFVKHMPESTRNFMKCVNCFRNPG